MNIKRLLQKTDTKKTNTTEGQGRHKRARKVEHAMNRCQTVLPLRSLTMMGDKQDVVIRVEEVVTSTFLIEVVIRLF